MHSGLAVRCCLLFSRLFLVGMLGLTLPPWLWADREAPAAAEGPDRTTARAAVALRVAVYDSEGSEAEAVVTAALKKIPGIEVLGRDQIHRLLGAQEPGSTTRERLAFGRALPADLLLLIEKGNAFAWIDAHTGEELFRIREDSAEALARSAVVLVEETRDASPGHRQ